MKSSIIFILMLAVLGSCQILPALAFPSPSNTLITQQTEDNQPLESTNKIINNIDLKTSNSPSPVFEEVITIPKTKLEALITINRKLSPYSLDSKESQPCTLKGILESALINNLDIRIAGLDKQISKANYVGSTVKVLPDILMGYNYQYLKGTANFPLAGDSSIIQLDTPLIIASAGVRYYLYRGGSVLFGALQKRNLYQASQYACQTTLSDTLLEGTKYFYNLLLNEALLQIRIKAVSVSEEQDRINHQLFSIGKVTKLEVSQSQTQLWEDRQNLIDQQIERRIAAIKLADFLNLNQSIDLTPQSNTIFIHTLVPEDFTITDIIDTAIQYRPELQELSQQYLAAKKNITIKSAPLQPTVSLVATAYGIGQSLSDSSNTVLVPNASGTGYSVESVSKKLTSLNSLGFAVNWNLGALGASDLANIHAAKLEAQKASLNIKKQQNLIVDEVRQSYLKSISTYKKLEEANKQVESASEELRLASLRFQNGLTKNIDVLQAQHDFTTATINKAQAIINYNIAQCQLLHDMGTISLERLSAYDALAAKKVITN